MTQKPPNPSLAKGYGRSNLCGFQAIFSGTIGHMRPKKGLALTGICGTVLSRLMLLYRLWNVEESGRKVTLAAFFCVRPKTAKLCEGLGKAPDSSI